LGTDPTGNSLPAVFNRSSRLQHVEVGRARFDQ
jgi:hypothetical protein